MTFDASELVQPPSAAAMSESMRSLGYTAETAIADIVDNSIAAGAKNVWIILVPENEKEPRRLAIFDDGSGMSPPVLLDAMRPGAKNPLDTRRRSDLGRFGLGLKTASFSQCRSLTVASSLKGSSTRVLRWDLDHVARTDRWELLPSAAPEVEQDLLLLNELPGARTAVVWSRLDRLAGSLEELTDLSRRLLLHLGLVFHRFLETKRLSIRISMDPSTGLGQEVTAKDPFLRSNRATETRELTPLDATTSIQTFILPHRDRCTQDEWNEASLGADWRDRQGLYVYRNDRLLASGNWMGLDRHWKNDAETQLARVKLDFTSASDAAWRIDVTKSKATPPAGLRPDIRRHARDARVQSARIFLHRYHRQGSKRANAFASMSPISLWQCEQLPGEVPRYRLNPQHPVIARLKESSPLASPAMGMIAEALPTSDIWYRFSNLLSSESAGRTGTQDLPMLKADLLAFATYEIAQGRSLSEVERQLRMAEPYSALPELVDEVFAALCAVHGEGA